MAVNVPPVSDAGFEKMGKPQPGDWLERFPEEGQTFEQYLEEVENRATATRRTIYFQPLGNLGERSRKILERLRDYAAIFFHCHATLLDPIPLSANGWVESRQQYNAEMVRRRLNDRLPDDAIALVGITDDDLFASKLNFVFGIGSFSERTGVYSLRRLKTEDDVLFLRRSLKLMNHEVGHLFSMRHCIFYRCTMNGSNSLAESDSQPVHLCPTDIRKLQWNTGFEVGEWYGKLRDFYGKVGMKEEARWTSERISNKRS